MNINHNEPTVLLDPTSERATAARPLAERPATLTGATVGILDISKARGNVFLDRIAEQLQEPGHRGQTLSQADLHAPCTNGFEPADRGRMPRRGGRPGRLRVLHVVLYA